MNLTKKQIEILEEEKRNLEKDLISYRILCGMGGLILISAGVLTFMGQLNIVYIAVMFLLGAIPMVLLNKKQKEIKKIDFELAGVKEKK